MRLPLLGESRVSRLGAVLESDGAAIAVPVARRRWRMVVSFMVVVGI
jgi:hypothetical protein